jgi:hypothetical protein
LANSQLMTVPEVAKKLLVHSWLYPVTWHEEMMVADGTADRAWTFQAVT